MRDGGTSRLLVFSEYVINTVGMLSYHIFGIPLVTPLIAFFVSWQSLLIISLCSIPFYYLGVYTPYLDTLDQTPRPFEFNDFTADAQSKKKQLKQEASVRFILFFLGLTSVDNMFPALRSFVYDWIYGISSDVQTPGITFVRLTHLPLKDAWPTIYEKHAKSFQQLHSPTRPLSHKQYAFNVRQKLGALLFASAEVLLKNILPRLALKFFAFNECISEVIHQVKIDHVLDFMLKNSSFIGIHILAVHTLYFVTQSQISLNSSVLLLTIPCLSLVHQHDMLAPSLSSLLITLSMLSGVLLPLLTYDPLILYQRIPGAILQTWLIVAAPTGNITLLVSTFIVCVIVPVLSLNLETMFYLARMVHKVFSVCFEATKHFFRTQALYTYNQWRLFTQSLKKSIPSPLQILVTPVDKMAQTVSQMYSNLSAIVSSAIEKIIINPMLFMTGVLIGLSVQYEAYMNAVSLFRSYLMSWFKDHTHTFFASSHFDLQREMNGDSPQEKVLQWKQHVHDFLDFKSFTLHAHPETRNSGHTTIYEQQCQIWRYNPNNMPTKYFTDTGLCQSPLHLHLSPHCQSSLPETNTPIPLQIATVHAFVAANITQNDLSSASPDNLAMFDPSSNEARLITMRSMGIASDWKDFELGKNPTKLKQALHSAIQKHGHRNLKADFLSLLREFYQVVFLLVVTCPQQEKETIARAVCRHFLLVIDQCKTCAAGSTGAVSDAIAELHSLRTDSHISKLQLSTQKQQLASNDMMKAQIRNLMADNSNSVTKMLQPNNMPSSQNIDAPTPYFMQSEQLHFPSQCPYTPLSLLVLTILKAAQSAGSYEREDRHLDNVAKVLSGLPTRQADISILERGIIGAIYPFTRAINYRTALMEQPLGHLLRHAFTYNTDSQTNAVLPLVTKDYFESGHFFGDFCQLLHQCGYTSKQEHKCGILPDYQQEKPQAWDGVWNRDVYDTVNNTFEGKLYELVAQQFNISQSCLRIIATYNIKMLEGVIPSWEVVANMIHDYEKSDTLANDFNKQLQYLVYNALANPVSSLQNWMKSIIEIDRVNCTNMHAYKLRCFLSINEDYSVLASYSNPANALYTGTRYRTTIESLTDADIIKQELSGEIHTVHPLLDNSSAYIDFLMNPTRTKQFGWHDTPTLFTSSGQSCDNNSSPWWIDKRSFAPLLDKLQYDRLLYVHNQVVAPPMLTLLMQSGILSRTAKSSESLNPFASYSSASTLPKEPHTWKQKVKNCIHDIYHIVRTVVVTLLACTKEAFLLCFGLICTIFSIFTGLISTPLWYVPFRLNTLAQKNLFIPLQHFLNRNVFQYVFRVLRQLPVIFKHAQPTSAPTATEKAHKSFFVTLLQDSFSGYSLPVLGFSLLGPILFATLPGALPAAVWLTAVATYGTYQYLSTSANVKPPSSHSPTSSTSSSEFLPTDAFPVKPEYEIPAQLHPFLNPSLEGLGC